MSAPFIRVVCVDKSLSYDWDVDALDWVPHPKSTTSGGPSSDVNVTNTSLAVTGTFYPATQPVSGTFWQSTQPVSGTFWQTTQPVSGTFWQSTQPVSLASVPSHAVTNAGTFAVQVTSAPTTAVTGTFWQATQPVSGTVTANLGTLNGAALDATVSTMSGKLPASVGQKAMAASLPVVIASDQGAIPTTKQPTGGTNVLKTGTITTTAATADQVVLTYTVTALKTFYLTYVVMYGRLTTLSATASILGAISLETPSGTKTITFDDVNCTTSEIGFQPLVFSEPIPIAAGTVVRVVVTPAAVTSMLWRANFGGYEK